MINLSVKKELLQDVTETEYRGPWTIAVYLMCSVKLTNTIVFQYKQATVRKSLSTKGQRSQRRQKNKRGYFI